MEDKCKNIIQTLVLKNRVKHEAHQATLDTMTLIKEELKNIRDEIYREISQEKPSVLLNLKDHGRIEAEFEIGEDVLIFFMQPCAFTFPKEHSVWRTSYVQNAEENAFCGMIWVFNFLADSFKYNREGDIGYLIARIFINREKHFFVEGKKRMGFLYNDFQSMTVTQESIREVLFSLIQYSLEFDMFSPPFEQLGQISVGEMLDTMQRNTLATGKRLGFKFNEEPKLNIDG